MGITKAPNEFIHDVGICDGANTVSGLASGSNSYDVGASRYPDFTWPGKANERTLNT